MTNKKSVRKQTFGVTLNQCYRFGFLSITDISSAVTHVAETYKYLESSFRDQL